MIYIHTNTERWEHGKKVLLKHGGKMVETSKNSGTLRIKMVMQEIVATYSYADGEASFKIEKLPFFLTDWQVAGYLRNILE